MNRSARQSALALTTLALSIPMHGSALAHGRPASLGQLLFDPGDPSRMVAQATWGAAVTEDAGTTWRWVCAAAMGVEARNQDPQMLLTGDGALLVGGFGGLVRAEASLCGFEAPSPVLADEFVIDMVAIPGRPGAAYGVMTRGSAPDQLFVTDDGGVRWTAVGPPIEDVLVERIVVAPSAPSRVYLGGAIPGGADRRVLLLVTDDVDAAPDRRTVPTMGTEWNAFVHAVDPTDPDRLFAQVVNFDGEGADERLLRSEDAGRTWETVLRLPQIGGVVIDDTGRTVFTGSKLGGLYRSDDGGSSWDRIDPSLGIRCLARRGDELFVCADPAEDGVALLRSVDEGTTFDAVMRLPEVDRLADCPRCSPVGVECPAWFPDLVVDLGLDADLPDGAVAPDAATGAPRDAGAPPECRPDAGPPAPLPSPAGGGCACAVRAPRPGPSPPALAIALLCLYCFRRCGFRT